MCKSLRITTVAFVPVLLALPQAPSPTASWLDPDRSEPAGTRYHTFSSRLAGGDVSYLLYLPPAYATEPEQRFPVVYWLCGLNGNQRSGIPFVEQLNAGIRTGKLPPMIVVLVNGMRNSYYSDSPDGRRPVESVIIKELIPHIDKTYRTVARREMRAVEGYSMGGYGAAHLGFKYHDVFGIVGVMAGALSQPRDHAQPDNDLFMLTRKNADAIRGKTAIRVAVGDQDESQPRSQAFHDLLRELKIAHEYEVVPGVGQNLDKFYGALGERAFGYYQRAAPGRERPQPATPSNAVAPSHVFTRGDREILTFETEQDYDRLQELYRESQQNTQPVPGKMVTRYYRSRTDGSVQPYGVQLPRDYSSERKYAAVINLHGLNFKEVLSGLRVNYHARGEQEWVEPNLPVIYINCFGRPSTFYQGIGELDVLEAIEDVKRLFSVDPDRVFIMGSSMGGAGAFTIGLHHPDFFGGITTMDAALHPNNAPPDDMPVWMKPQVAILSPVNLYPNARNVDVFFKNAGEGIQRRSTDLTDGIVAQGGFSTSESFPGMPHSFAKFYSYTTFISELIQHPIRRKPAEIKFYTNTLQYDRAYWLTIDRLTRHNADALVIATCDEGVRVSTSNIDAFTLRLGESPAPKDKQAALVIDGQEVFSGPLPGVVHLSKASGHWTIGEWSPGAGAKRHGLQGPIGDAFNSQFLAVYGEGDRGLAVAELDAIRNPPGPLDLHGDFPMKPAAKVTKEDVASSNLILFGTAKSNAVLQRIAPGLPAGVLRDGGIFVYPNPENPSRYVVIWSAKLLSAPDSGLVARSTMPLLILPDYLLCKDGKIVSGGHFDNDWNLR